MYLDKKRDLIHQMSWKTKCKRFECCFSDVNVRNPILTEPHVWESYNSNFLYCTNHGLGALIVQFAFGHYQHQTSSDAAR